MASLTPPERGAAVKTYDEPFGLPRGSIRAFLTVLLVGITSAIMFVPIPSGKDDVKSMFVLLTGIAVRDYFASRERPDAEREAERRRQTMSVRESPQVAPTS
jgi:hypothetical protein